MKKEWVNKKIIGLNDDDLSKYSIKKIQAKENGSSEASVAHAKILGQTIGKYNMEKMTKEDKSRGGKIAGKMRTQMPNFYDLQLKAGRNSGIKRTKESIQKYKNILSLITIKEFTFSDMRNACEKYGVTKPNVANMAKKILKQKTLVKQIHKGYNQYNPSLYIIIK